MLQFLEQFKKIQLEIKNVNNIIDLEKIRIKYLGKKGYFKVQFTIIKTLELQKRKEFGIILNKIVKNFKKKFYEKKQELEHIKLKKDLLIDFLDVSLPGRKIESGTMHPITLAIDDIESFFYKLGFNVLLGPEIENEYYNFDALNIHKNHPSRESHDTFHFDSYRLLRTQTSNMQIRVMEKFSPPFKIIVPGKVYRRDNDITHTPMFHQVEGLVVEENVNFSYLKWMMNSFLKNFFNNKVLIRFRSSYFPFTVPSIEVDIMDKNKKWLEVLGCGMVHPYVLKNVNIDNKKYSACAFGIGVERITMLRHEINDLRYFFENDLRFIKQFK